MSERTTITDADEATDEDESHRTATTGAESVVIALEKAGVEKAFGVQGGAIMPVYDALYDSSIEHFTMAHEQGAAHAADAYGIVSGEPGVAFATSGPGATNLVTGIADASMDSDPLIALTGQVATDFVGNDAFQETDTVGITQPVTKNNYFAGDVETVGDDVGEAFALAEAGRQGPTLVDLPKDTTKADLDVQPGEAETPDTYNPPEKADEVVVEAAAEALQAAEKPVILSGGGVIKGEATDELRAFARTYDIPVITTMPGLGTFPETDDLSLGMAGMHGTGTANMAITNCDVLLGVGTRFDDRLTGGVETFAPDAEVIHAEIDPAEINKNIEADYPLLGDAERVLEQLDDAMTAAPDAETWREQCDTWKAEYPLDYEMPEDEPLKPQYIVERFDELADDDAIITTGVGQHQMWAAQFWTYTEPRTWVSSNGLGTMGYGVPSAIGAKTAAPDTEVITFDGDGSFLMTMQELSVAVRENLDITYVILNNEAIGMVRQWQDGFYEGRRMASEYQWVPEFDMLAEAFGARGFRLEEYDEVDDVIEAARAYDGPAVIDAIIDPGEDVYPMVPSGGDNGLFALSNEQLNNL
ncbi:acetolactate synthase I-II-III large subunit protein [Halorhabdus tiamatea SARL4B]|uniref:Acetolactate synthase n=1 Tax=Halorhabdus tiamatea SARL4B TaxID=1033806 RepID=F7PHB4_9EURY|nr:biosynthetic-type acetolactate synthase large subunit [Halorhabdus tiamatea]ERJ05550.1 acetolactate synthase I-II-III large subunit protein [Halorhabdus tiamatea SARL4B]CCQ32533.1 acetolactate synthase large subunit [Halorhabdus tiamatea SARL4B]